MGSWINAINFKIPKSWHPILKFFEWINRHKGDPSDKNYMSFQKLLTTSLNKMLVKLNKGERSGIDKCLEDGKQ